MFVGIPFTDEVGARMGVGPTPHLVSADRLPRGPCRPLPYAGASSAQPAADAGRSEGFVDQDLIHDIAK